MSVTQASSSLLPTSPRPVAPFTWTLFSTNSNPSNGNIFNSLQGYIEVIFMNIINDLLHVISFM